MFFQKHYELFSETLQCFFKNTTTKKNNKKMTDCQGLSFIRKIRNQTARQLYNGIRMPINYSPSKTPSRDNCLSKLATPKTTIAVTVAVCSRYSGIFFVYKSRSVCHISP